jgi:hypothetical protein
VKIKTLYTCCEQVSRRGKDNETKRNETKRNVEHWRIRSNDELEKLREAVTVKYIKARRIKW